ncbi:MAG: prepilin-type N-terminal cleavage/methylation domain-containing protein [Desulfobacterales bacterium]|nr:MAG: prepilin-type N-terminal cleavage/methylation domain-containing protein [Desulfobacterales bacterium]
MERKSYSFNQKGFTLIELISVMIILSVMASVSVKKLDLLSGTATNRAIQESVKELNIRESLTWTNIKLSNTGWTNDGDVFSAMDTNLGADFEWTTGPNASGGTLRFRTTTIALTRTPSTTSSMGSWN